MPDCPGCTGGALCTAAVDAIASSNDANCLRPGACKAIAMHQRTCIMASNCMLIAGLALILASQQAQVLLPHVALHWSGTLSPESGPHLRLSILAKSHLLLSHLLDSLSSGSLARTSRLCELRTTLSDGYASPHVTHIELNVYSGRVRAHRRYRAC